MLIFFSQYYYFETKRLNYVNLIHLVIRSVNFFMMAFLIIWSSYYANLAEINFGIVSAAICIGAPLNCIFSKIFWGEKLSFRMIGGTTLIICGVVWVGIAKGARNQEKSNSTLSQEEKDWYRIVSICLALCSGCLGSLRIQQAKYVNKILKYDPMDFSIDAGIISGIILLILATCYFIAGEPTYTFYNFWVAFGASILQMSIAIVGLNAAVKGLAGPTAAIMQMQAIVGIALNAVFLAVIPTLWQCVGALLALGGALILILSPTAAGGSGPAKK